MHALKPGFMAMAQIPNDTNDTIEGGSGRIIHGERRVLPMREARQGEILVIPSRFSPLVGGVANARTINVSPKDGGR